MLFQKSLQYFGCWYDGSNQGSKKEFITVWINVNKTIFLFICEVHTSIGWAHLRYSNVYIYLLLAVAKIAFGLNSGVDLYVGYGVESLWAFSISRDMLTLSVADMAVSS